MSAPCLMTWGLNCKTSQMQGQLRRLPASTFLTSCTLNSEHCAAKVKGWVRFQVILNCFVAFLGSRSFWEFSTFSLHTWTMSFCIYSVWFKLIWHDKMSAYLEQCKINWLGLNSCSNEVTVEQSGGWVSSWPILRGGVEKRVPCCWQEKSVLAVTVLSLWGQPQCWQQMLHQGD